MLRRNHLVRTLRRMKAEMPEHADALKRVIESDALQSQVFDELKVAATSPLEGRPILTWLWENRQIIIQIIIALIARLGAGS